MPEIFLQDLSQGYLVSPGCPQNILRVFETEELDESVADVSGDTLLFEDIFGLRDPLCMSTFSPTEEEPIAPVHVDDLEEVDGSMGDEDIDQYLNL